MHTLYHILPVLFHLSLVFSLSLRLGGGVEEELVDPQLYNLPYNQVREGSSSDPGQFSLEFQNLAGSIPRREGYHDFTEPSSIIQRYIETLKIYPKTLEDSDKDIWPQAYKKTYHEKQPLKGDTTLASYALSKFWDIYQMDGYRLNLEQDLPKSQSSSSIRKNKILYQLPDTEIPIYFVLGAYEPPTPSLTKSFGICFWMFERTKIGAKDYLIKHFLGTTHIPGGGLQNHIIDNLPNEHFMIPSPK